MPEARSPKTEVRSPKTAALQSGKSFKALSLLSFSLTSLGDLDILTKLNARKGLSGILIVLPDNSEPEVRNTVVR